MTGDIDNDKLGALVGKMLGDLGGAFSVPTASIGFRLGLFDALHGHGPASAARAQVTNSSGSSNSRSGTRQKKRSMVQPFFS